MKLGTMITAAGVVVLGVVIISTLSASYFITPMGYSSPSPLWSWAHTMAILILVGGICLVVYCLLGPEKGTRRILKRAEAEVIITMETPTEAEKARVEAFIQGLKEIGFEEVAP